MGILQFKSNLSIVKYINFKLDKLEKIRIIQNPLYVIESVELIRLLTGN